MHFSCLCASKTAVRPCATPFCLPGLLQSAYWACSVSELCTASMLDASFLSPWLICLQTTKSLRGILWVMHVAKKLEALLPESSRQSSHCQGFLEYCTLCMSNIWGTQHHSQIISAHSAAACQAGADAPLWQYQALQTIMRRAQQVAKPHNIFNGQARPRPGHR